MDVVKQSVVQKIVVKNDNNTQHGPYLIEFVLFSETTVQRNSEVIIPFAL